MWVWPRLNLIRRPRHQFQKIEKELRAKPDWPKLGTKDYSTRKLNFANDSNRKNIPNCVTLSFVEKSDDVPIVVESFIDDAVEGLQEPSSKIKVVTPTPSRSNSIRNKTINFRTFHSSTRRGEYTINGPHLHPDTTHEESIPMTTSTDQYDVEATAQYDR